jgi:hypothetical protein
MSFIDDHMEDIMLEQYQINNYIERMITEADDLQIIKDVISVCYLEISQDYGHIDMIKGIIETSKRQNGLLSRKQKWRLIEFLIENHDHYEPQDIDHPFHI